MTAEAAVATVGDNRPPEDASPIRDRLAEQYVELGRRADELVKALDRVPETIEDDETAGKVADFTKQLHACIKNAGTHRVAEKEPYLEGGRQVDGYFKKLIEPVEKAKKEVERRLTEYQRVKAAEERRRREEEERKAREAAERAAREAAEAEAKLREEKDLEDAIAAQERSEVAEKAAREAERAAEAKAADLSRSRGDYGSVASLRTRWTGEMVDRAALDLEALRQHLAEDALNKAVRSFVKAGGRELTGAKIWEEQSTVVR